MTTQLNHAGDNNLNANDSENNEQPKVITKKTYRLGKKKRLMLAKLEETLGIVSAAARAANISRQTHYDWMKADPQYAAMVDSIQDIGLDVAETKLISKIREGDTIALLFYLKCKGKRRGYIEKTELELPKNIVVEFIEGHE